MIAGKALVETMPASVMTGTTAPTAAPTWQYVDATHMTSKAARFLSDGSVVALLLNSAVADSMATLVGQSSGGGVTWGPTKNGGHGEGTDLVVTADGNGLIITGHGDAGNAGTLSGRGSFRLRFSL